MSIYTIKHDEILKENNFTIKYSCYDFIHADRGNLSLEIKFL